MSASREQELKALRTQVTNQAASLAETVTQGFNGFHLGGGEYTVDLQIPDGPSTGGGARARQSIRLVPRRPGYAVVVAGTVDPVTSTAELRTFEHAAVLHEVRFRGPFDITAEEYEGFLKRLDVVLKVARVTWVYLPVPAELLEQRKALDKRARASKIAVPALVAVVVVALVVYAILRAT